MDAMRYFPFLILLLASACLSALITPFLRTIAFENGVVDVPGQRKIHQQIIPRVGGIAVAVSFFSAVVIGYSLFQSDLTLSMAPLTGLCIGGALVLLVGIVDDINIKGLRASKKFVGQVLAALALIPFGFLIETLTVPFIGVVNLGSIIGISLTIAWVVGITNAFNLIDGMDGLSSGMAVIAAITLTILSILTGNLLMTIVLVAILGSTLGFLYYNWPPAKMFIGDCGAMFLGFLLAAVSIETSFKSSGMEPPVFATSLFAPILALGLPIIDTCAAISRRAWHRKPLFSPDRQHIHHRLLDAGFTSRQAVLVLYGVSIGLGVAALATTIVTSSIAVVIVVIAAVLAFLAVGVLLKKSRIKPVDKKSPIRIETKFGRPTRSPERDDSPEREEEVSRAYGAD